MERKMLCNECKGIDKILNKIRPRSYYIAFEVDVENKILVPKELKSKLVFFD